MNKLKVYIAGPISAHHTESSPLLVSLSNIKAGIRASVRVLLDGHIPFSPFLDYQFWFHLWPGEEITETMIKDYSIEWLKVCDCMIVLPGWEKSKGTIKEMNVAKAHDITIYHGVESFIGALSMCY